jgi:prefoldin subunit 5
MGVFGFGKKKDDVVDLGEHYRKQQARKQAISESDDSIIDLGNKSSKEEYVSMGDDVEDKRQKLAKRIVDMTNKIEELSNQVYHLQQRLEVVEKKTNVSRFE